MLHLVESVWGSTYVMQTVAVVCAIVVSSIGYNLRHRNYKGPKSYPLLGAAIGHIQNYHRLHHWLLTFFQKNSTIAAPMPINQVFYYTVDPANVKHILKTNFPNYPKGEVFQDRMQILLGDGIFNTDGEMWRTQRKTAAAEFSLKALRDFSADSFKEYACQLANVTAQLAFEGRSYDMQDLYMRMTLDSIGKIGFGVNIGSLSDSFPLPENEFAIAFDRANEIVTQRFIDPLWKLKRFLQVGGEADLNRNIRIVDDFVYGVIAKRKLERKERKAKPDAEQPEKADIISRFLDLSESGAHANMSDKILRDVVLNFVIAGRDTTAVTLSWMTYMLAEHPAVARRLYEELRAFHQRKVGARAGTWSWAREWEEIRQQLGEEEAERRKKELYLESMQKQVAEFTKLLNYESLKELNYMQAVLTETLRLFPAVPLDPKGILEDDVLPDGTFLKKGNLISYSPWCMARMKSIWGSDAAVFNPDRWLQSGVFVPESEYKFTTFQAGLRTCLGKDSAYLQLKIVAGTMCRFFEFRRTSNHYIMYRMMATLSMQGGLDAVPHLRTD
ncbi:protein MpCYP704-like1 [Marchantia polymorpha subsp. ruderalis]|uniref:Cytochrome P450 n=2 Tax=Marchantia polymorpha TaxID=3197 RepID=A0A176VGW1_MARPO|nr:hypothetical protein AXG93_2839s1110 [Marchantia polymorpha subsp. ruderalis]PTQ48444.1 hypothetical protein MARPO_0005s0090 [Marchantia polymorpha]BBM97362.1 hypothetical protein Mp_1g05180 [Marchantia polymorpha subsp. ruderalis]|eukprot:PTQ48444.1 hypothetical protein MARPO_0005s0090 [Marchantia polymorpha]